MSLFVTVLVPILKEHLEKEVVAELGKDTVERRMTEAIPGIASKMKSDGITLKDSSKRDVIRSAIFRLWKVVVHNGHAADVVRDRQDDKIVAEVEPKIDGTTTMRQAVTLTKDAVIRLTF